MISKIKNLLDPKPAATRTITLVSAAAIRGRHHEAGTSITLPQKEADSLIADGTAIDPEGQAASGAQLARLNELLPPARQAQALPEYWKNLPPCWARWWELNEAAVGLIWRRDEIERKLVGIVTKTSMPERMASDLRASLGNLQEGGNKELLVSAVAAAISVGAPDPERTARIRHLENAYFRAAAAVDDFRQGHGDEYILTKIQCGDFVQDAHLSTCRAVHEMKEAAFELFATRISELGLAEREVRRLFSGSADFMKVAQLNAPALEDLRVAWSEGEGRTKLFVDRSPATMAGMLESWDKLRADAEDIKKQVIQELSRSQKARKAAA